MFGSMSGPSVRSPPHVSLPSLSQQQDMLHFDLSKVSFQLSSKIFFNQSICKTIIMSFLTVVFIFFFVRLDLDQVWFVAFVETLVLENIMESLLVMGAQDSSRDQFEGDWFTGDLKIFLSFCEVNLIHNQVSGWKWSLYHRQSTSQSVSSLQTQEVSADGHE